MSSDHVRPAGRALLILSVMACLLAGSAAFAKHPPIFLYDKNGDEINPIDGEATQPFSTEFTCGLCHDYEAITSAYHFQMGWDNISDDYDVENGRPWSLSDGLMGRWYPYAFRQLAKKHNDSPDEIDLTVYDFVGFSSPGSGQPPCGACHPGGGGLQYDRDGNRYDDMMIDDPELAESLDGDYHGARWDKSGVVEADCFVCHLEGYNFDARVEQLEQGNYQWAVVAGSRIGIVSGSVTDDEAVTVQYNRRLFNEDGSITLAMSWPPPDDNCEYCHGTADVSKRGFSWNDIFNPDIHNQQGVSCVACHPSGADHQIAKGDVHVSRVADDLDNTMKDCRECHFSGYLGAPVPEHKKVRPSHIKSLSCESCHIPRLNRAAAMGVDATTGELEIYTRPADAGRPGDVGEWHPAYERRADNNIYAFNSVLANWWGNRDADSLIYPLFLREHEKAWELYRDVVADDNGDGRPEVNTDDEIFAGLTAVAQSLEGNARFENIRPVYVKGEKTYELGPNGQVVMGSLVGTPLAGASAVDFSISHNVAPTRLTLGANGCGDCHTEKAHFFKGQRVVDLFGSDGQPITRSNGAYFGCSPLAFAINSFHQQIISPYVGGAIILIVFLIVLHYHSYGPKRITFDPYSQEIQRFSLFERGIHLFRLIAFVVLTVTGLIMAFNLHLWQDLLFSSADQMLDFHIWSGVVFIVTTVFGLFLWFRDALFASYDRDWVRRIGGYLGYKGEVPAGRFNAGQKMFYWYTAVFGIIMSITGVILILKSTFSLATICVTSTVHNLFGFILIAGVLAHAYLGTIANPGTWRVLVDGSVTREWARHHHPNWYRGLLNIGLVRREDHKSNGEADSKDEAES